MKHLTVVIISFIFSILLPAQNLKPGFDPEECRQMLYISARTSANKEYAAQFPEPGFKMLYQSQPFGFDNLWDLWENDKSQGVISIRGTTGKPESWLANVYAAMVSANGYLVLAPGDTFHYKLAKNPNAAVHAGWLTSTGFLAKQIVPKIDSLYKKGVKNFFITGHSQGGAIAYLMTAYLHYLVVDKKLPSDIVFKTYCTAGPKPGNLEFAYDYESYTQLGWAYNVINAADWVPQVPFSIQTTDDYAKTNPFKNAKKMIKKLKFPIDLVLGSIYSKMEKAPKKARDNFKKYLGNMIVKVIKKNKKDFVAPAFYNSSYYVRTGNIIVLTPNEEYYTKFAESDSNIFVHHFHNPYLYLMDNEFRK